MHTRPRSPRALLVALIVALVGITALVFGPTSAPAGAAIINFGASDTTPADTATITVSGELTVGNGLSIALCNLDYAHGLACNATSFTRFFHGAESGTFSLPIEVDASFANVSFVPTEAGPGGETTCAEEGSDPCALVLVEYFNNVPVATATEVINLTF